MVLRVPCGLYPYLLKLFHQRLLWDSQILQKAAWWMQ